MTEVLYYPIEYDPSQVATLGTILDEKDGKVLVQPSSGWGQAMWVPKSETRIAREVYVYEFWKKEGFILKPMTHIVIFALFFLLIY